MSREWYKRYQNRDGHHEKNYLTDDMMLLIKYIISSNAAFNALDNEFLGKLVLEKLKVPSSYTFRNNILPQILEKVKKRIQKKLEEAKFITLIPDCWTSLNQTEFLGTYFKIKLDYFKIKC